MKWIKEHDQLRCMQQMTEAMDNIGHKPLSGLKKGDQLKCTQQMKEGMYSVDKSLLPTLSARALTRLGIGVAPRVPIPYSSKTYNQPQQHFSSNQIPTITNMQSPLTKNGKERIHYSQYIQEQVSYGHGLQTGLPQIRHL